jgi:hypothetical protein
VNDDFHILFQLLEGGAQEVSGRAAATVSSEVRENIAKFAAGRCNEEERAQMKKMLLEQPDLIPMLVTEIRALRPSDT